MKKKISKKNGELKINRMKLNEILNRNTRTDEWIK